MEIDFSTIKIVVFDLDGTIYFGNSLADHAQDLVNHLQALGKSVLYLSNSSSKTRFNVYKKLRNLGLDTTEQCVYTTAFAAGGFLREKGFRSVFCIGTDELKQELSTHPLSLTENAEADCVIVGLDPDFHFSQLKSVLPALLGGASVVACNKDIMYPSDGGILVPGAGAIVAAVESLYGKQADYIIGKPSTYLLEIVAQEHSVTPKQILMVGDSFESDISMALRYGSPSILISQKPRATVNCVQSLEEILKLIPR